VVKVVDRITPPAVMGADKTADALPARRGLHVAACMSAFMRVCMKVHVCVYMYRVFWGWIGSGLRSNFTFEERRQMVKERERERKRKRER